MNSQANHPESLLWPGTILGLPRGLARAFMVSFALLILFLDSGDSSPGGATLREQAVGVQSEAPRTRDEMEAWIAAARSAIKSHLDEEWQRRFDREFYPEQTVREWLGGASNVFVVAPHGYPGDDDHTDYLAYFLSIELNANYLINNKAFHKPGKSRPTGTAANLNRPWSPNPHTRRFMERIVKITRETGRKSGCSPLVIAVHGMSDANARRYAAGDYAIGAGYTRSERDAAFAESGLATASRDVVEGLLRGLRDRGHLATDGIPQYSAKSAIPAFLKQEENEITGVQAVQIEVRYRGFRDPNSLVNTARSLAAAIRSLPVYKGPRGRRFTETAR